MRILYIDIDTLRPDHLGCYGYHRDTSPNIDAIAADGVRFNRCYASDVPCLPSRSALFSGRPGALTGVINHGGVQSERFPDGVGRDFRDSYDATCWMKQLRNAGLYTATVSSFGERHSAYWFNGQFNEIMNCGKGGMEQAHESFELAKGWFERMEGKDDWFLHFHIWDPHTPYRVPEGYGNPFADEPLPAWLTEEVRAKHWQGIGPHSAREICGYHANKATLRQPGEAKDMTEVRRMFDGYDVGVHYADHYVGKVVEILKQQGIYDDTVIMISSDHGENLGELNVYGDHQYADEITSHIPMILRWPGSGAVNQGRVDDGLCYHFDVAATMVDKLGVSVPGNWYGVSFLERFDAGQEQGRDFVTLSNGAWSCQRGVRWGDWLLLRCYHDGYHGLPERLLFNIKDDPNEQHDLAAERPDKVGEGTVLLDDWVGEMMRLSESGRDPMWQVMVEGGSYHTRGQLPTYLKRLEETGRGEHVPVLQERYAWER